MEKQIRSLAVMTSGGDAPGMNPCIRAVVRTGIDLGLKVFGVEDGFEGLIHGNFSPMGARDVGGILQRGGTILRTTRCDEFRSPRGQLEAIRQMNSIGIDALIVIGGGGSLAGAMALAEQGIMVAGIAGSIDNDVAGTDMCIGVDTALNTIVDAIDKIRDTAASHSRAFLVETMGRNSGYLAIQAGIVTGAEAVLVPEQPTDVKKVADLVSEAYRRGKTHCIIVVAEGANPPTAELARLLDEMDLGFTTRVTILGHIQRGGKPSSFDRLLASRFGTHAVKFLLEGKSGFLVSLDGHDIVPLPLQDVVGKPRDLPAGYLEMAQILAK